MKVKKNDEVIIISGKDKGRRGQIFCIFPSKNKVLIRGINFIKKTEKKSQQYPNGRIFEKESPIDISNVMLYCPKVDKGVRIEYIVDDKGNKRRKAKGIDYFFDN